MKLTVAISFCLLFAYAAHLADLAPIIGAFAAGLVLEQVHFEQYLDPTINDDIRMAIDGANQETKQQVEKVLIVHGDRQLENLIHPLGYFLTPLFFVLVGMKVELQTLFDPQVLGAALIITLIAFAGKVVAGVAAGSANKWAVGWGMAPRGEVGLIFAAVGQEVGIVSGEMYSIIIVVVVLTTLLTPPVLTYYLNRNQA